MARVVVDGVLFYSTKCGGVFLNGADTGGTEETAAQGNELKSITDTHTQREGGKRQRRSRSTQEIRFTPHMTPTGGGQLRVC